MKTLTLASALLLCPAASPPVAAFHFTVDGAHSEVTARVAFFGIASKTARFPQVAGSIQLSERPSDAVALEVMLDATLLTASDRLTTARLKSASFFDVAHYPTVRFTGSQMHVTGPASADVTGELQARGVSRPVTLAVRFSRPIAGIAGDAPIDIDGRTTIDRRDFGMTAYPLVVGRDVTIAIRAHMVPVR